MASLNLMGSLAILLVLLPITARSDTLSPSLSPLADDICKDVQCGKGTCKATFQLPVGFICECEPNWKHTRYDNDPYFNFLPCVIPNCTLDYSCTQAPPPVPEKQIPINESFFDPCYWAYCGDGTCNKSAKYTHDCQCKQGYSNLLNVTAFPCFSDCTLGTDCASLGLTVKSTTSSNANGNNGNGSNQASSILPRNYWLIILLMSLAIVPWK